MNYNNYVSEIALKYSIILDGWPFPTMKSPSKLGGNLGDLRKLLEALRADPPTCFWREVSDEEIEALREGHEAAVASGERAPQQQRKRRKDAGKKRAASEVGEVDDDTDKENEDPPAANNRPCKKKPRVSVRQMTSPRRADTPEADSSTARAASVNQLRSATRSTGSSSTNGIITPPASRTTPSGSLSLFGSQFPSSSTSAPTNAIVSNGLLTTPSGSPALYGTFNNSIEMHGSTASGPTRDGESLSDLLPSGSDIFADFDEYGLPKFPLLFPSSSEPGPSNFTGSLLW